MVNEPAKGIELDIIGYILGAKRKLDENDDEFRQRLLNIHKNIVKSSGLTIFDYLK